MALTVPWRDQGQRTNSEDPHGPACGAIVVISPHIRHSLSAAARRAPRLQLSSFAFNTGELRRRGWFLCKFQTLRDTSGPLRPLSQGRHAPEWKEFLHLRKLFSALPNI